MSSQILRKTEVRCQHCGAFHPARISQEEGKIVGRFRCQAEDYAVELSHDATLYREITDRGGQAQWDPGASRIKSRALQNLIEITNTCNFRCPICYASCGPEKEPNHLSPDEVVRRMRQAKERGAKNVSLSGGEPSEHPQLLSIIRAAVKLGVQPLMPTNGYRLGTDPGFARELKRAGLHKASIQLDSFDPDVHRLIRGNTFIEEKKRAFDHAAEAGLRLGMIATVTHLNLREVPSLVAFALRYAPALDAIALQIASTAGRHQLPPGLRIDREQLVRTLVAQSPTDGLREMHFWPLPTYRPWGLQLHPDCGIHTLLMTAGSRSWPLEEDVDVEALYRRLGNTYLPASWLTRALLPSAFALRSIRRGHHARLLPHLLGSLTGRGQRGIVLLGIGGFCSEEFFDLARIARCATMLSTSEGPVSPCLHYQPPRPRGIP
jgi:molybdenum cofactor biosynthesis enzyme MoaA